MSSLDRIRFSIDLGTWDPIDENVFSVDPINFHSKKEPYKDLVKKRHD